MNWEFEDGSHIYTSKNGLGTALTYAYNRGTRIVRYYASKQ